MYLLILSLGFQVICTAKISKILSLVLIQLLLCYIWCTTGLCVRPSSFLIYVDGLAEMPMHGGSLIMFTDDALLYKVAWSIII